MGLICRVQGKLSCAFVQGAHFLQGDVSFVCPQPVGYFVVYDPEICDTYKTSLKADKEVGG